MANGEWEEGPDSECLCGDCPSCGENVHWCICDPDTGQPYEDERDDDNARNQDDTY